MQQQVVVSAIDAAGLVTGLPSDMTNAALQRVEAIRMRLKRTGAVAMSGVLAYLSSDTGGVFFHNSNDFAEGFREAAAVPEIYYVLSFSPQDVKLNGQFHSLKVSLASPDHLSVQARRGYFASEATLVEKAPGASELERAVFSLEEVHGLPAEVSAKVEKLNDQKSKLIVSIHVNIASLALSPGGRPQRGHADFRYRPLRSRRQVHCQQRSFARPAPQGRDAGEVLEIRYCRSDQLRSVPRERTGCARWCGIASRPGCRR